MTLVQDGKEDFIEMGDCHSRYRDCHGSYNGGERLNSTLTPKTTSKYV